MDPTLALLLADSLSNGLSLLFDWLQANAGQLTPEQLAQIQAQAQSATERWQSLLPPKS